MPKAGEKAYASTVMALKPKASRYVQLFDGGLGVRVFPTGTKTWVYWYRQDDRKRMLTLGSCDAMGLAEAQEARNAAAKLRTTGIDPASAKVAAKQARQRVAAGEVVDPATLTLRQAFAQWRENDLAAYKDGGAALQGQFNKHVFPALGDRLLRSIGKGDVMALLERTKRAGKLRTAAVLLASLRQMLDYCENCDYINANPTRTLRKKRIIGKLPVRTRVLADDELKRFVQRISGVDLHIVTALALRFVLATGQRPGEVAGMPKAEVVKDLWTIPATRYKTGEQHQVPLSPYARSILAEAAKYNAGSDYVFPSPTRLERPIDRHSLSRAILRKLERFEPGPLGAFTPHDLRRTCRTGMAALGVPDYVAEKVIGHRLEGMLAVYNQHPYLDERREALARWGAALQKLKV